jgi:transcriptional regulator with XRE-family HTH domain
MVRVGEALKRFRSLRGWSTRELAGRSGVSAAMISDVERAAKSPTITILSALAAALEIPLSRLVDDAPEPPRAMIVRSSELLSVVDGGARRTSLGPMLGDSRVEFVRLALGPLGTSGQFAPHPAGSLERVHVVTGNVEAQLGSQTYDLAVGDTLVFAGDVAHAFANRSDGDALMFLVVDNGRGELAPPAAHGA